MQGVLWAAAFLAGFGLTIQVGMNAALRTAFGNAGVAVLVNFLVGSAGLALYLAAVRADWPTRTMFASAPAWAWLGGLLGAFYVVTATIVGPRLGAAALLVLTVLGQLVASLIVDHFGWLGFPQQPITLAKIVGALLLLAGVVLVVR